MYQHLSLLRIANFPRPPGTACFGHFVGGSAVAFRRRGSGTYFWLLYDIGFHGVVQCHTTAVSNAFL